MEEVVYWRADDGKIFEDDDDYWYHMGHRIAELQGIADDCMKVVNGG